MTEVTACARTRAHTHTHTHTGNFRKMYDPTAVLEKTLESPLDCKEIQPVHSEEDQSWDFFGRNDLKLKLQYFGHLM